MRQNFSWEADSMVEKIKDSRLVRLLLLTGAVYFFSRFLRR